MSRLHLITTCTQGKHLPPGPGLAMRDYRQADLSVEALAQGWLASASQACHQNALPARQLYKGAHWRVAQDIVRETGAHLSVISAGLGLLSSEDHVPGYQATFSAGQPDTLPATCRQGASYQSWWETLGRHSLPGQTGPRTLTALMQSQPADHYVIVASPPYVQAIANDLAAGIRALICPQSQCAVITSGNAVPDALRPFTLRSRQSMQPWLGGGVVTLNIRLGRHLVTQEDWHDLAQARARIAATSRQRTPNTVALCA